MSASPSNDHDTIALTEALLDLDNRQSIAESAVQAAESMSPELCLRRKWEPIADLCYQASATYLATVGTGPGTEPPAPPAVALAQLRAAAEAVDRFRDKHHAHLHAAIIAIQAMPSQVEAALAEANDIQRQLNSAGIQFADFPSVLTSTRALALALDRLDRATANDAPQPILESIAQVRAATVAAREALTAAPAKDQYARHALSSIRTRLAAVQTRTERIAPTLSSLLREFNLASSVDLGGNERACEQLLARASCALADAETAQRSGQPERALELTSAVRADLAAAEALIEAVTGRLQMLRDVRNDPSVRASAVRFKIRDARMLAVSRGLTMEWGPAIDAQSERLDHICEQVKSRNPDYFSYLSDLDAVLSFVEELIGRMRNRPVQTGRG